MTCRSWVGGRPGSMTEPRGDRKSGFCSAPWSPGPIFSLSRYCRWWTSWRKWWWMCRKSCLSRSSSCALLSSLLTFQFPDSGISGFGFHDFLTGQDRIQRRLAEVHEMPYLVGVPQNSVPGQSFTSFEGTEHDHLRFLPEQISTAFCRC